MARMLYFNDKIIVIDCDVANLLQCCSKKHRYCPAWINILLSFINTNKLILEMVIFA